ncbi:MAG: hypothetical protein QXL94_03285 [Candidatus Parvarchaeum sp.]
MFMILLTGPGHGPMGEWVVPPNVIPEVMRKSPEKAIIVPLNPSDIKEQKR